MCSAVDSATVKAVSVNSGQVRAYRDPCGTQKREKLLDYAAGSLFMVAL